MKRCKTKYKEAFRHWLPYLFMGLIFEGVNELLTYKTAKSMADKSIVLVKKEGPSHVTQHR